MNFCEVCDVTKFCEPIMSELSYIYIKKIFKGGAMFELRL